MPYQPLSQCLTCRDLLPSGYADPTHVTVDGQLRFQQNVNFDIDCGRPVNVTQFEDLKIWHREDCSLYNHYRCPICGTYYRHEYHYDSGGGVGPSFEMQELVRLRPATVRRLLADHYDKSPLEKFDRDWPELVAAARLDLASSNTYAKGYAGVVLADERAFKRSRDE